ncbi:hypothetical protein PC129_g9661 [Phytophthora cactorum]|uniref:Uncharacterized protein n=1 Tax=Phytophthora cactorum TaxID=29920 RepID=A0A329SLC1_9STRA|nr:hypothetical protein Pcac1_g7883 [Phytophthora cactorum]KAG2794853.1 hypothetical protein PC111_g22406 [Phytophthora cactorum]KAG2842571.1 hypothetical protein PC112_g2923 [Phytophthora cactorum]KAG2866397.1 hypothetical protein PC113_g2828 [Phytophthora cactorum]KAG2906064.1 hypothetical protein PC115_g14394 [Phytophthora cactorum]
MTSQAPVILNRAGAMVCHPITVSDSSRRQTKVNVGAPLKERTRGLIDASAGTTKQGEATVVNDLTLSAGSVITVAEASDRVWPSVGETTQPTTATGDASCANMFIMGGSANSTDTAKASSSLFERRKTILAFQLSYGLSSMKAI